MRWPRRGILIRLAIYVPLIGFLAWRAQGGCGQTATMTKEDDAMEQKLAPHRKVITLPDGTQQEIVELTAEEAEAILGHPIPRDLDRVDAKAGDAKAGDAKATGATAGGAAAGGDVKAGASASGDAAAGAATKAGGDAADGGKKAGDAPANPDATSSSAAKAGDAKAGDAKADTGSATK